MFAPPEQQREKFHFLPHLALAQPPCQARGRSPFGKGDLKPVSIPSSLLTSWQGKREGGGCQPKIMPVLKALCIPCLMCVSQKPRAVVVINSLQYKHTWPDFPLPHKRLHACLGPNWDGTRRLSVVSERGSPERCHGRTSRRKASRDIKNYLG